MDGRTVVGSITQSGGGVGRNMADALEKLKVSSFLISAVGEKEFEKFTNQMNPHLVSFSSVYDFYSMLS